MLLAYIRRILSSNTWFWSKFEVSYLKCARNSPTNHICTRKKECRANVFTWICWISWNDRFDKFITRRCFLGRPLIFQKEWEPAALYFGRALPTEIQPLLILTVLMLDICEYFTYKNYGKYIILNNSFFYTLVNLGRWRWWLSTIFCSL